MKLDTFAAPTGQKPARFFGSVAAAKGHMEKHLLSAMECFGWSALLDTELALLASPNDTIRRAVTAETEPEHPKLQVLYDAWKRVVECQQTAAQRLGWLVVETEPRVALFLGLYGVLGVFDGTLDGGWVLRTAFLPAYDPRRAENQPPNRCDTKGWRRYALRIQSQTRREVRPREDLLAPAIAFLLREHVAAVDSGGLRPQRDYYRIYPIIEAAGNAPHNESQWLALTRPGDLPRTGGSP